MAAAVAQFRPGEPIACRRALYGQVGNLTRERTRFVLWMRQALDHLNVQAHRPVTDLTGPSGMTIVRAISCGDRDPLKLAALRSNRCRKSPGEPRQEGGTDTVGFRVRQ